ncbi:hypothetical protein M758_10G140500 [Ceratodon purpureus]|nr:hypothetical protein M758_10G140500 [Ceratodon purpureus]
MATKAASALGNGLNRTIQVSPALQRFLGVGECSRPESMKRIWDYIKDHKLQNPQNKKEVFCDETLKPVLGGKDKVGFLEIAKLLSEHFPKAPKVPKTPKAPKIPKEPKLPKEPKSPKSPRTRKVAAAPAI